MIAQELLAPDLPWNQHLYQLSPRLDGHEYVVVAQSVRGGKASYLYASHSDGYVYDQPSIRVLHGKDPTELLVHLGYSVCHLTEPPSSLDSEHNKAVQRDAANEMRRHIQELKDSNRGLREQNELLRRVLLNLLKGV